jgi:penicillin-binding protein 2B
VKRKKRDPNYGIIALKRIMAVVVVGLIVNIAYLCVTGKTIVSGENIRDYNKTRGAGRITKTEYATRGTIYTSDGEVAAKDVKRYNLITYISPIRVTAKNEPAYVVDKRKTAKALSKILGADEEYLYKKMQSKGYQVEFGNYSKNLSAVVKDKIERLKLPGLEFKEVRSRNYTFGDFASYEIGYAKSAKDDDKQLVGELGIEKSYNNYLQGKNGKQIYLIDSKKNVLPGGELYYKKSTPGNDVYLTIDSRIQTELDSLMKEFIEKAKPDKATCAIMEAKTGKILAVSDYPSFDPNKRNMKNFNSIFLNDAYECGSAFKVFVYANALTDKVLDINDYYHSGVFTYRSAGKVIAQIHDVNRTGWGRITYGEGLYRSSNVAICNILQSKTNMKSLISDYDRLGFFKSSTVDGLTSGSGVKGYDGKSKSLEYYTTGFGQGSSVTPFQLLRGYSVFANDGKYVEPYLVEKVVNPTNKKTIYSAKTTYSEKIYSTEAVKTMKYLMYGVTHNKAGTVHAHYKDSEVDIIGKSGTGQVAVNGSYSASLHSHTFAGLAPYDDPEVVFVITWQNTSNYTGDAANVIKAIAKSALNIHKDSSKKVKTNTYTMPNFTNQSVEYANNMLKKNGVTPIIIGEDGKSVTNQYPESQSTITSSSRVMIATDGNKIIMPSMEGWSRKEAEAFGALSGVTIETEGAGTIYKQDVEKGAEIKLNQKIKVYAK